MTALHRWFAENGVALNLNKSEAMLVSTAQRAKEFSSLRTVSAAGSSVKVVSQIRLLGETLDVNLNFNAQIKNVCRASYFHIRALRHIRSSITENMANSVACALIQSPLVYANALYAGMSSTNFDKVQRVQNTLARVVTLTAKSDHITPTLERLHWLPIRYRVDYKQARLTYNIHLSGKPPQLRSQLVDYTPVRSLRSLDKHLLFVPRTKLACASHAFSVAAPQLWNSLPVEVHDAETLTFSKRL